ncbi:translation initiation factor Sui1 [bacterium]|nr:translation initiation factor Sui1 [bacterium]
MKENGSKDASLVYSSELGRMCPNCGKPSDRCVCRKKGVSAAGDGTVRIRRETKGRGGKTVTVISGIPLDEAGVKAIAGELKRRCGTGGTVKEGTIEIQGDHCQILIGELEQRGFRVKRAGG